MTKEMIKANARRIVACVNACAGIPTDTLEANTETGKAVFEILTMQRDDLLVAGNAIIERWDTQLWKDAPHTANYINALRESIAAIESPTKEQQNGSVGKVV